MASAGEKEGERGDRAVVSDRFPLRLSHIVRTAQWTYLDPQWRGFSSATEQCLPLVVRGQWLDLASRPFLQLFGQRLQFTNTHRLQTGLCDAGSV